jgi:DNA-binding NarL/FixJ family response regulator
MGLIRTLLIDDSPEFLEAAQRFLASDQKIEVVGALTTGKDAVEKVTLLQPDLVLIDLAMPGTNGLEATRGIKEIPNPPQVIILTLYDNYEYQIASEAVHADGFISKSEFGSKLLPLIQLLFEERVVAEG